MNGSMQEQPNVSPNKTPDSLSLQSKDTDGDGVYDDTDKCINEKGPASNFGCPVIQSDPRCMLSLGYVIFFTTGSFKLSRAAIGRLNKIVTVLNDNPELYIRLSGFTDNVGNYDLNMKLCIDRVKVTKSFFLLAGIDETRIIHETTYGSKRPIDDDRTKTGRAKNRRVEIDLNAKDYL